MDDFGLLAVRVALGFVMMYHGTEKLLGWWGGEGIDGATAFFERLGYRPPRLMAYLAAVTESIAGVLMILGLLTPIATMMLIGILTNVMAVHLRNGFSRRRNGIEYETVLLATAFCMAATGPGRWSLDQLFGVSRGDRLPVTNIDATLSSLVVMAIGLLSGIAVVSTRRRGEQRPARADERIGGAP